jgi:cytoskeleton protein RodZ
MSNSDNEQPAVSTDFGSVLSEARKAQNFTVEDISEHLKIPVHTILEIETNDLDALPAPTFTQGYIRVYAKFLEISEDTVLEIYNAAIPHESSTDLKPRSNLPGEASSQSPLVKLVTLLLILAVITAVVYGSFQYYQEKADVMEDELESKAPSFTGSSLDSPTEVHTTEEPEETDSLDIITDTEEGVEDSASIAMTDTSTEGAVDAKEVEAVESAPQMDTLEIYADEGSWMEVRDASRARLFYNMVPVRGSKLLTGEAPFRVSLGNARTTRLVVNGVEVDISEYIRSNNTATVAVSTDGQSIIFH